MKIITLCLVIGSLLLTNTTFAQSSNDSAVQTLTPELRALLTQEMKALLLAMQQITPAQISGDFKQITAIAQNIEASFVLKQQISNGQKQELQQKLPNNFLVLDAKFHQYAGMLAHVAEQQQPELVDFYVAKLTESCGNCHAQYAQHRFPLFKQKQPSSTHHH
jgi:cytochrome c556